MCGPKKFHTPTGAIASRAAEHTAGSTYSATAADVSEGIASEHRRNAPVTAPCRSNAIDRPPDKPIQPSRPPVDTIFHTANGMHLPGAVDRFNVSDVRTA
jgi:hypothetical protein